MAVIDLSTLTRKTPEGRVDPGDFARTVIAVSLNKVFTGRDAKHADAQRLHVDWRPLFPRESYGYDYCWGDEGCLGYRLACCLACRRRIWVDAPRQPCGIRTYHRCPKEVAA